MPPAGNSPLFTKMAAANTPLLTKLAIGKVTTELAQSETLRNQFIADPNGFLASRYGIAPSAEEAQYFTDLASRYADGACCKGCGCGAADAFLLGTLGTKVTTAVTE